MNYLTKTKFYPSYAPLYVDSARTNLHVFDPSQRVGN